MIAGEIAHLAKCLPHKQEDVSIVPKAHRNTWEW